MPGITSRFMGKVEENGKVRLDKLLSFDIVADPGFTEAKMKTWTAFDDTRKTRGWKKYPDIVPDENQMYKTRKKVGESWMVFKDMPYDQYWWGIIGVDEYLENTQKIKHPDIDPYGEENWDDDNSYVPDYARNLLPVGMRIAAHTIGLDLVSVVPISAPIRDLAWLDFKWGEPEKPKGKQIFSEIDPYGEECWED
jgi:hypothetical protein